MRKENGIHPTPDTIHAQVPIFKTIDHSFSGNISVPQATATAPTNLNTSALRHLDTFAASAPPQTPPTPILDGEKIKRAGDMLLALCSDSEWDDDEDRLEKAKERHEKAGERTDKAVDAPPILTKRGNSGSEQDLTSTAPESRNCRRRKKRRVQVTFQNQRCLKTETANTSKK